MNDYSPLFMACKGGNENLVKYLVELGADVNKENKFNETPLYGACEEEEGKEKIVKYLVEHGINIKIVNMNGYSPLFMTCKSGNKSLVKYLVELGADINDK